MTKFLGLRGNRLNLVALFGVMMPSIVSLGYNQSLLGGVLTLQAFEDQFPEISVVDATPQEKSRTSTIQGTVVALYAVGGLFGAISCIGLGDLFGRRRVIMIASVIQLIGAILTTSAFAFAHLIVSRLILGLGTGGLMATAPVWLSELSSTERRGMNVSSSGLFAGLGATIALFVDFGMSFAPGSVGWRFPAAVPVLLSLIILGFIYFLPESPRWLIRKDRIAEAREILTALDGMSIGNGKIEGEIQELVILAIVLKV
ncbi:sugar transporter [Penicillium argentinense]|uniref:Sugar transporter n=1 Tax=Penicillium argentinense TaxID=1131581 RepID=A0A9W9JY31_9EURO|nr:sugar transporter [Penicillium argentinense]KAJ5086159.1 sugar transporter [Penicillium argentinense]